jgi:hypothetical protein
MAEIEKEMAEIEKEMAEIEKEMAKIGKEMAETADQQGFGLGVPVEGGENQSRWPNQLLAVEGPGVDLATWLGEGQRPHKAQSTQMPNHLKATPGRRGAGENQLRENQYLAIEGGDHIHPHLLLLY